MSTRSLTRVHEGDRKYISMHRQFDGYPSVHGAELHKFLSGMTIINGICGEKAGEAADGASCLAAQMVAAFKTEIGNIYMCPVELTAGGQDYEYIVDVSDVGLSITVNVYGREAFKGDVEAFGLWCARDDEDEG